MRFNNAFEDRYSKPSKPLFGGEHQTQLSADDLTSVRLAVVEGMRRGWDWKKLRKHSNPHVRRAAASNLASGRQTVIARVAPPRVYRNVGPVAGTGKRGGD